MRRMVHDTLFSSQEVSSLPIEARWLYAAMIVHADDEGRMRADPHFLKLKAFPFDKYPLTQVKKWRNRLSDKEIVRLYEKGGKQYLYHPKWEKWQNLRKDRLKPSDCPPPDNQVTTNCQPMVAQGSKEVKELKQVSSLTSTLTQPPPLRGASATRENGNYHTPPLPESERMTREEMHAIRIKNLGQRK